LRAASLAKSEKAALTVMEVLDDIPSGKRDVLASGATGEMRDAILRYSEERLEKLIAPMRDEGIKVSAKVLFGTQFLEIIREVIRNHHDLVILSPQRRARLKEMLFGSRIMHLMRKCPCPVWVVLPSKSKRYARIMAAVDPDSLDDVRNALNERIIDLAASLSQSEKSDLHIIHCWSSYVERAMRGRGRLMPSNVEKILADVKAAHKTELNNLLGKFDLAALSPKIHLFKGEADKLIVEHARKKRIDLLVMGTLCRTGLKGFFIGNTAEKVLHNIGCSVLALKPEGFVSPVMLENGDSEKRKGRRKMAHKEPENSTRTAPQRLIASDAMW
ncbi:MAG: universal stress protein, partial [Deltaproteobacteria bacterium]